MLFRKWYAGYIGHMLLYPKRCPLGVTSLYYKLANILCFLYDMRHI